MSLFLIARIVDMVSEYAVPPKHWRTRWLDVRDTSNTDQPWSGGIARFQSMCSALMSDIQSADGSGADFIAAIRDIEAGTETYIKADGNAHIAFITPHEVWFGNLYVDIDESPVSFRQYKLAVETWVKFLADPERKPIVVRFPDDVLDRATLPPRPPRNNE